MPKQLEIFVDILLITNALQHIHLEERNVSNHLLISSQLRPLILTIYVASMHSSLASTFKKTFIVGTEQRHRPPVLSVQDVKHHTCS